MTDKTRRRDLMRPAQLLGVAFVCAAFAGIITALAMGAFEALPADAKLHAWSMAGIVAGIAFIVVLLGVSLLLLAVSPTDVDKEVDRPVLMRDEEEQAAEAPEDGSDDQNG